jgi:hypothetical protein
MISFVLGSGGDAEDSGVAEIRLVLSFKGAKIQVVLRFRLRAGMTGARWKEYLVLLSDTEFRKNIGEQIFVRYLPGNIS